MATPVLQLDGAFLPGCREITSAEYCAQGPGVWPAYEAFRPVTWFSCRGRAGGAPPAGSACQLHCAAVPENFPRGSGSTGSPGPWCRGPVSQPFPYHTGRLPPGEAAQAHLPRPSPLRKGCEALFPPPPLGRIPSFYCSLFYIFVIELISKRADLVLQGKGDTHKKPKL